VFRLGPYYLEAYRSRLNANLAFYDGLDGKTDWPLNDQGDHPLTEFLLARGRHLETVRRGQLPISRD
jgi:hypothetical protein